MKRICLNLGVAALLISAALTSCQKSAPLVPVRSSVDSTQVSFSVQSDSFDSNLAASSTPVSGGMQTLSSTSKESFVWTGGEANINKFMLTGVKDGKPFEFGTTSPYHLNFYSFTSLLPKLTIPQGLYKKLKVKLVLKAATGSAKPFVLKGVFTTGGGTHWPVEFDFNENVAVTANLPDINIDSNKGLLASLNLHLGKFLTSISAEEIDHATRKDGHIIISSTSNVALYNKIKANFLSSVESLFKHTNQN